MRTNARWWQSDLPQKYLHAVQLQGQPYKWPGALPQPTALVRGCANQQMCLTRHNRKAGLHLKTCMMKGRCSSRLCSACKLHFGQALHKLTYMCKRASEEPQHLYHTIKFPQNMATS